MYRHFCASVSGYKGYILMSWFNGVHNSKVQSELNYNRNNIYISRILKGSIMFISIK